MKRLLLCLFLCLALSLCNASAEVTYEFDAYEGSLTAYSASGEVLLPEEIDGIPVRSVGMSAFRGRDDITSLVIPEPIQVLYSSAMYNMVNLGKVTLPQTLEAIDSYAFFMCTSLESVTIPSNVRYIGSYAFAYCDALQSVIFEGPCPVMPLSAFDDLSETATVTVPEGEEVAFAAVLPEGTRIQSSGMPAVPFDDTPDESLFSFDSASGTILSYNGTAVSVSIPSQIAGVPVRAIGNSAFAGNHTLFIARIPEGVEDIAAEAFWQCTSLNSLSLPSSLRTIGDKAFRSFNGTSLTFPEGLESIGNEAFRGCRIQEITLPDSLKTIGDSAFYFNSTSRLSLPAGLESIGDNAFGHGSISYIYLRGTQLPPMADNAFERDPLADIDIASYATKEEAAAIQERFNALGFTAYVWRMQNERVEYAPSNDSTYEAHDDGMYMTGYTGPCTAIRPYDTFNNVTVVGLGSEAFKGNQILSIFSVPYNDCFTTIESEAFAESAIREVDLFDSVTTLGDGVFRGAAQLKSLTLPASLTKVGSGICAGCTSLSEIHILCDPMLLPEDTFAGCTRVESIDCTDPNVSVNQLTARFGLTLYDPRPDYETSLYCGTWYLNQLETADGVFNAADLDVHITLTINEDGPVRLVSDNTILEGIWRAGDDALILELEDGVHTMHAPEWSVLQEDVDGTLYTYTPEPPVTSPKAVPVSEEDFAAFGGVWYGHSLLLGGKEYPASIFGDISLSLAQDGTAQMLMPDETQSLVWHVEENHIVLYDGDESIAVYPAADSGQLYMNLDEDTVLYLDTVAPEPVFVPGDPVNATPEDFLGTWNLVYADMGSMMLPVSMFESELKEAFNLDEFVVTVTSDRIAILGTDATADLTFADGSYTSDDGDTLCLLSDGRLSYSFFMGRFFFERAEGSSEIIGGSDGPTSIQLKDPDNGKAPEKETGTGSASYSASAYAGRWTLQSIVFQGETYAPSFFDMDMILTLLPDGTATVESQGLGNDAGTWSAVENGISVNLSAEEIMRLDADGHLTASSAEMTLLFVRGDSPTGSWYLDTLEINGEMTKASDYGIVITLVLESDGTVLLDNAYEQKTGTWAQTAEGLSITMDSDTSSAVMEGEQLTIYEQGSTMVFTRQDPGNPEIQVEEPVDVSDPSALYGDWEALYVAVDGHLFPASLALNEMGDLLGSVSPIISVNAQGVSLFGSESRMPLTLTDGALKTDATDMLGTTLTLRADGRMTADLLGLVFLCEKNASVTPSEPISMSAFPEYIGKWYEVYMETAGRSGDPRVLYDLQTELTLSRDGTARLSGVGDDVITQWYWDEGAQSIIMGDGDKPGVPLYIMRNGFLQYNRRGSGRLIYSRDPEDIWNPETDDDLSLPGNSEVPAAVPSTAPSGTAVAAPFAEQYLTCTKVDVSGYVMDGSALGQYAVTFHGDGTADFILAGQNVSLSWYAEVGQYIMPYPSGDNLIFTPVEGGLQLDFFGSMLMTFEPQ